jgi:23S rRNA (cytidine2498-2'-O)-methyltransferase
MLNATFLYTTCQIGAEPALKREIAARYPDFRFAYSRPGFVTFKLPADRALKADFRLESIFARAYGFVLGKVNAETIEERAQEVYQLTGEQPFTQLHVWPRDQYTPGHHGYTPGLNEHSAAAREAILAAWPESDPRRGWLTQPPREKPGQLVLDVILVGPNEWYCRRMPSLGRISKCKRRLLGRSFRSRRISKRLKSGARPAGHRKR